MTQTQKKDCLIAVAFGFCLVMVCFVMGVFEGIDQAMDVQLAQNKLSVYCQQAGSLDKLCAGFRKEGVVNGK